MTIRQLDKTFVGQITALYQGNFSDGWSEGMLESGFDGGRLNALGAFFQTQLVGVVTFSLSIDDADIEGVVVDKQFRKQGIGEKLMRSAHEFILGKQIKSVLLEVRESNKSAISLYQKLGYQRIAVRKNYYSDGENALVLRKEL